MRMSPVFYTQQTTYTYVPGSTTVYITPVFPIPRLFVKVTEARNLVKKELMGLVKSDPYCVVECRGKRYQTIHQKSTQFPVWGETFEFNQVQQSDMIHFAVYDYDSTLGFGKHGFMGECYLNSADFVTGEKWYALHPRPGHRDRVTGDILIKIQIF